MSSPCTRPSLTTGSDLGADTMRSISVILARQHRRSSVQSFVSPLNRHREGTRSRQVLPQNAGSVRHLAPSGASSLEEASFGPPMATADAENLGRASPGRRHRADRNHRHDASLRSRLPSVIDPGDDHTVPGTHRDNGLHRQARSLRNQRQSCRNRRCRCDGRRPRIPAGRDDGGLVMVLKMV